MKVIDANSLFILKASPVAKLHKIPNKCCTQITLFFLSFVVKFYGENQPSVHYSSVINELFSTSHRLCLLSQHSQHNLTVISIMTVNHTSKVTPREQQCFMFEPFSLCVMIHCPTILKPSV